MAVALTELFPHHVKPNAVISGMALDSRKVKPGDLFVALSGETDDGHRYIQNAVAAGASAVVSALPIDATAFDVPMIIAPKIKSSLGSIASTFYGEPSKHLRVVAVTGTNGKTSVTYLAASAMEFLSRQAGVIGTLGFGRIPDLEPIGLTTPDAITFQRSLAELVQTDTEIAFVEASSHGLTQFRLEGTQIDAAVMTNVTRDHLDYHGSLAAYRQAKARLLAWPGLKAMVLNADDPWVFEWSQRPTTAEVITFSTQRSTADISIECPVFDDLGCRFVLKTPVGAIDVQSTLLGTYNLSNLAAVASLLYWYGVALDDIGAALTHCKPPPGRLECVARSDRSFWVDFAHTPDAVEQVLTTLRRHFKGRLITVLGCGGDRDPGKRSEMGRIAYLHSDECFFTSDNPRSEDPADIITAMCADLPEPMPAKHCLVDRKAAIFAAVNAVGPGDVAIVLGKGHETHQEINGVRYPFCDQSVVEQALSDFGEGP